MMGEEAEERKPVYVHCGACDHQWVAFYTPLKMDANGMRLMKSAAKACPMCAAPKVLMGPSMTSIKREQVAAATKQSVHDRAHAWIAGSDRGVSSETIWGVMMGAPIDRPSHPHDPADFGRCARLLRLIPEWRARIHIMAGMGPYWDALTARWDEVTQAMDDECGIDWNKSKRAEKTYALMRSIYEPVEAKDKESVRGSGFTIRFGSD